MSNATELLNRALRHLEERLRPIDKDILIEDIRAFLAVEPEAYDKTQQGINDMRKLNIGTEKYTKVFATDTPDFGANHAYIVEESGTGNPLQVVHFQKGPIREFGVNGCMNEDLIAMVIDRLEGFQSTPFKCRENALAITKLEEALLWLRKRTMDREARGVEGTHVV